MTLTYDGHDLESLFICGEPEITILVSEPETRQVPLRDGLAVTGNRFGASNVTFAITALGSASERRAAFSTLGKWLDVDSPKHLVLPDTPDRYYLAIPDGGIELSRAVGAEIARISFAITDPAAYGATRTADIPSGGSVTVQVDGTYPAEVSVTSTAATRDGSTGLWGVSLDSESVMHVAIGASTRTVRFLCGQRKCQTTANRVETLMTLDSDWFAFDPGNHTVTMDEGTGAATLTWIERWL